MNNKIQLRIHTYLRPHPTESAQFQSKPLKVSQIFPDPSKYVAISTRIQRNLPNPTKINLNLSSKRLSNHPIPSLHKSHRIYWNLPDPPKQLEFIKNQTTPIKFTKPNSNIPKSIRIHFNLQNRLNRVKPAQISNRYKLSVEPMQINPNRLKS